MRWRRLGGMLLIWVGGVVLWVGLFFGIAVMGWLVPMQGGTVRPLSRAELDAQWEDLLRRDDHRAVEYLNRNSPQPSSEIPFRAGRLQTDIWVQDRREMNVWGYFGLAGHGGWQIMGRREAEFLIPAGVLQLYTKEAIYWSPGFLMIEAGYDLSQYPLREFRLVLRDPVHSGQMRVLHSVQVTPLDVLPPLDDRHPWGPAPKGTLVYDAVRNVAVLEISNLHHPVRVEVPVSQAAEEGRGHSVQ